MDTNITTKLKLVYDNLIEEDTKLHTFRDTMVKHYEDELSRLLSVPDLRDDFDVPITGEKKIKYLKFLIRETMKNLKYWKSYGENGTRK